MFTFIDYAGFYTTLMNQRFRLLKKPGSYIKKGSFMHELIEEQTVIEILQCLYYPPSYNLNYLLA
ncbi:hypothetical protein [Cytobacillus firmus]|uniref:hypothetical protein n=1 Tax=Cytobacillus firmus TaxID=1399 RepID=UPI001C8CFF8A|nr:hypothetical protein [Cytobacillus firmus]MBX9976616.1 hypothetical protein [Cytobacillus firmus]